MPLEIVIAVDGAQIEQVRNLFTEYWSSFGFCPCFQNFEEELATLPGKYASPAGRLALALLDGEPAGCIVFRPLDAERCEAKRLYVRPAVRGRGAGRALLNWMLAEARAAGYREIVGDTLPVMSQALAMYDRAGFERTGPYVADPVPGAIFVRFRV